MRSAARREPNTRATTIELYDGLAAASQNCWPSLRLDLLAANQIFSPIFGAGFYYKTFMWPAAFWEKLYEPAIRRAAGLGRAAEAPDPDHYEKTNAFCDVLVIGGGSAGLSAALAAARSGARVILCEEDFRLGGRLLAERYEIDGRPALDWVQAAEAELESLADCRILRRTTVQGVYDGGTYAAIERVNDHVAKPPAHEPRQRLWRIVAKRAALAAGAIERPIVFGNNDRPGVMLAGAVRSYVNRYGVTPGRRAVIFADNDDAFRTAEDLAEAGVTVAALIDARKGASPRAQAAAETAQARYLSGATIQQVRGGHGVRGIVVGDASGKTERFACDLLAVSGGWNPTVNLTTHLNGKPQWSDALSALVTGTLPPGMSVAGAAKGSFGLGACLAEGHDAGLAAAAECGFTVKVRRAPAAADEAGATPSPLWQVANSRGKAFVDFQNDVTVSDVKLAAREGFRIPEHLKRYTTLGMATDQGKTSNANGAAVLANVTGRYVGAVGTTTFRPPYTPIAISAFAGHHRGQDFRPARLAPSHAWAEEQGAVFVETGPWLRALYYPKRGEEPQDAVNREVANVRKAVGVCDVSTLGKIDVQGRDAGVFLDRVYANTFSALPVGKARYGLMLREDGFVLDDGTTARLAEDHYFMTTTTANAVKVMQHLEFAQQCLWPELDVELVSVTEQWAQYAVAGPRARDVLQAVVDPAYDLSNAAFPYLACGDVTVCGGTPGAALSPLVLRRAGLRGGRAGALRRQSGARHHGGGGGVWHRALRHRGARRAAHREGPPSRRRAERADHGARSRFRQDAVGQEGFHRPLHGGTAGADRSRATIAGGSPAARPGRADPPRRASHPERCRGCGRQRSGLRHLDRLLAVAQPLARARPARARARAAWRDPACLRSRARRRCAGRGAPALLHRSGRGAPPCLTGISAPCRRSPTSPARAASARRAASRAW